MSRTVGLGSKTVVWFRTRIRVQDCRIGVEDCGVV